ncbi:histidine phosphatase family protein [Aquabacterium sp. A7-Y]|uniref:histidine phosphatase family protein n=1 Tax=Aquabacterium sp. A7-Y TaxID=1349605 RepID=UPI00223D4647|nr:histidine phosphatase family protein [Aquabacterium sp. A7-Y]MCW7541729.1 histidine phosphatase family protein [Aquabacterium sp. A7-Y]
MPTPLVLLLRHAEKPDAEAGLKGVTEQGDRDPQSLSVRGWQRAGALVRLFAAAPEAQVPARLPRPATLFAAPATQAHASRRPVQTLLPLARELGLEIRENCASEDPPDAVAKVLLAAPQPVLLCWRHKEMAALAATLLQGRVVPPAWTEDRYDLVWLIRPGGADPALVQLPQLLLPRDSAQPLA